jgi:hypothetical protein
LHCFFVGAAAFVTLLASSAVAQWTPIREENGVTVYEARAPGRTVPVLLGVTTIDAPPHEVLSWILDVSTHTGWMYRCAEARPLRKEGDIAYSYSRLDFPWPASDRDVIVRVQTTRSPDGSARVEFRSTDDVDVAEMPSVVRMPLLAGRYDLTPIDSGGTRVEYRVDSDPGGSLPEWLVQRASRDLPYVTLVNLRSRVEAGRGGAREATR